MFAEYNKNNAKGTLVGNWVEEEALRSGTGFSRRRVPAPYFAPDMKDSRRESTHGRVLLHTKSTSEPHGGGGPESSLPFETTNQANTKYGEFAVKAELPGPRSSRRDMELLEQAKRLCEQQEFRRQADERSQIPTGTLTKASYLPLDPALLVNSTRVPRGRNGTRVVDPAIQHLTKRQVDSIDQMKLELLQGNAVTRYSHAVATGVGLDFVVSASDSGNPFGRSSTFTNEIYDPSKRHGEATEPGSDVDERVGTNLHQRSALKRLVLGFQSDLVAARELLDKLTSRSQGEFVQISDFRAAFADSTGKALGLSDRDVIHVFMHFDIRSVGAIHLPQFRDFCASSSMLFTKLRRGLWVTRLPDKAQVRKFTPPELEKQDDRLVDEYLNDRMLWRSDLMQLSVLMKIAPHALRVYCRETDRMERREFAVEKQLER